jgi:ABC-type glycerol-3-phosphate transport system permease component
MIRKVRPLAPLAVAMKYVSLILGCLMALVPLITIFMASLKTKAEMKKVAPFTPPNNWFNTDNYVKAFDKGRMGHAFVNTSIILLISVVGTILLGSMVAYAVDRFEFRLKKTVLLGFLLAALVPSVTTQVATFRVVNSLGLFNTRWAAIVLFMGTDVISIYIFLQFLRAIPRSIDEAALVDGASHFTIYRKLILPLLKPAIATVVIIKGVAIYNEFYTPFLYMPDPDLGVVSTSLFKFKGPFGSQWEVISAGVVIAMVPTLVVFLLLQKHIYNGLTRGAVR